MSNYGSEIRPADHGPGVHVAWTKLLRSATHPGTLITTTRKDKVAPFLLGWGASAATTWWLSKQ